MEDECIGKLACENHLMPQSSTHAAGIAFMVLLQHYSSCFPAFQIKNSPSAPRFPLSEHRARW